MECVLGLSKQKGFDEWFSNYSKKHHYLNGWEINDLYLDEVDLPKEIILSLIQKWLREVHNIVVFANISNTQSRLNLVKYNFEILINNNLNTSITTFSLEPFNAFEEALEEGLKKGLNLINND